MDYVEPPRDNIEKPYRFNDNLFYGFSIGGSYSMSEFVKQQKVLSMIRPNIDFFLGKTFTKAISTRISLGYHCQAASIGKVAYNKIYQYTQLNNGSAYSIHMANIGIDGMLSLNRIVGNKNQYPKVKLSIIAGGGMNLVLGYSPKTSDWSNYLVQDTKIKIAPEVHVGVQSAFRISDHQTVDLQCTWHQSTKDYTGFTSKTNMRHYIEFKIGLTNHMLNRYISYSFENCRGNEKYYFNTVEKKLLEQYKKERRRVKKSNIQETQYYAQESDTILSFPHTYPYLTPYQVAKLEKLVRKLKTRDNILAVIDVYPYSNINDEITFTQSVDRSKEVIQNAIKELWCSDTPIPIRYIDHVLDNSPIIPDGIWFHNAFIHYEKK